MKKTAIIYAFVLALIALGQTAWAQSSITVATEAELRAAIQNHGANINVTADIELSNSTLSIESGKTITIDLNGHTLDRRLNSRGEGGGQVITVRSGATLYLSNGTLKGGWGGNGGGIANEGGTANLTEVIITGCKGDDRGGGISNLSGGTLTMTGGSITNNTCYDHGDPAGGGGLFNAEGATATLTNVTITGNEDMVCGGGGICNYGTLLLDGCTITGNKARTVGGGIWSGNEKHLLKMQGANIITDNIAAGVPSNLFMKERRLITLTGSITGSRIGIMLDVAPNQFTDGYATYHNGEDPNTFFTCDKPWVDSLAIIQPEPYVLYVGEVIMRRKNLKGKVPYIEHSWDSENQKVISTVKILTEEIGLNDTPTSETQYKKLKSTNLYVDLGTKGSELHEYYVVEGDELNIYALDVIGPNVHIILRDSAYLHLDHDIGVEKGNTVYFHAQSTGSYIGKLTVGEGIGGETNDDGANIEIHGGNFDLQGTENSAAIGGKYTANGDITIYDGHIKATGEDSGVAGIGGGYGCTNYGNITIYGGKIDATGSAGIGGGPGCLNGNLTIWDGAITAHGKGESAGIGNNQFSEDYGAGTITINGGYIRAYGDTHGAGIGGGDGVRGGTLNVNGGRVDAYGGTDAAGIGGGEGGNGGIVNITGGYVYAEGNDYGAGIGGGEDGAGADVTITGGVVIAKAGGNEDHPCAIGRGSDADNSDGQLTFADNLGVFITTNLYRSVKANRVSDCRNFQYVKINECAHGGATCTDNGSSVDVGCLYCYTSTMPYTFNANGNWNDTTKWFSGFMPHEGKNVAVKADATIPADYCANVGNIALQDDGTITIADGGQLIHSNAGVTATVEKEITSWTDVRDNYYLMALPFSSYTAANSPLVVEAPGKYDLYTFDGSQSHEEWRWHPEALANGQGFLYADSIPDMVSRTLSLTGTLVPSNDALSFDLAYTNTLFGAWNLVGNPFACNATTNIDDFYVINGTELVLASGTVAPLNGIFVRSTGSGQSVTFTSGTSSKTAPALNISLSKADSRDAGLIDRARIRFDESEGLEKFMLNPSHTKIYIPQDGKDYAVVNVGRDAARHVSTMDVNFKATEDGRYTITVNPEGVNLAYLHLIDNMIGADVNLLVHSAPEPVEGPNVSGTGPSTLRRVQGSGTSYTFTAKTTDYESRFKLVFATDDEDGTLTDTGTFAFNSNGNWIISNEGEAILQLIDINGRILSSETISGSVSKAIDVAPGVYILKLNDKVQKIVIR